MGKYSINNLPADVLRTVALKAKKLRKAKGFSQENLAERSGVSYGSIKRFEQTGHISFESLLKLSHVLGRLSDFESLFTIEETPDLDHLFTS